MRNGTATIAAMPFRATGGDEPEVTLRAGRPDDVQEVARVQLAGWRAGFAGIVPPWLEPSADQLAARVRELAAEPSRRRVVAELEGSLVGFCAFGPSRDVDAAPRVGEVYAMFVDPGAWRRGVGAALVSRALRELRASGFEEVTLWSFADNARANAFYERRGLSRNGGEQTRPELGHAREVRYRRSLHAAER